MKNEFDFLSNEIKTFDFNFKRREEISLCLKGIKLEDFFNLLNSLFIQNTKEFCCWFVNKEHKSKHEEFLEKLKINEKEREVKILHDSLDFKKNHEFKISNRRERYINYLNNVSKLVI